MTLETYRRAKTESITALPELGFYHEAGGRGLLTGNDTDIVARDVQVGHGRAMAHRCNSYPALVEALEGLMQYEDELAGYLERFPSQRKHWDAARAALQLAREGGAE
jgi:hypothetical protein